MVIARANVPNLDQKVSAAVAAFARYSELNRSAVEEAAGSQFTAEYTYDHPQSLPDTHDFRLIYGITPKSTRGTLFTLNLAGSFYSGQIPVAQLHQNRALTRHGKKRKMLESACSEIGLGRPSG